MKEGIIIICVISIEARWGNEGMNASLKEGKINYYTQVYVE